MLRFTYEVTKVSKKNGYIQYLMKPKQVESEVEDGIRIKLQKIKLRVLNDTNNDDLRLELGQEIHLSMTRVQ